MRLFADEARKREIMRRILRRREGEDPSEERIDIALEQWRKRRQEPAPERVEKQEWEEFGEKTERERAEQVEQAPQEEQVEQAPESVEVPPLMEQLKTVGEQTAEATEALSNLAQLYAAKSNELTQALGEQEKLAVYVPEVKEKFDAVIAKVGEAAGAVDNFERVSNGIMQQTKQFLSPGGGPGLGHQLKDWYSRMMGLPHRVKKRRPKRWREEKREDTSKYIKDLYRGSSAHRRRQRREELASFIMQRLVTGAPVRVTPEQVEYNKLKRQITALFQELDEASQQVADQVKNLMTTYFSDKSTLLPAAKAEYDKMRKGLFSDEDKRTLQNRKAIFKKMWGDGTTSGAYMQMGYSGLLGALADLQAGAAQLPVVLAYLPTEIGGKTQTTDKGREVQDPTAEELETEFEEKKGASSQLGQFAQGQSEVSKLQRRLAEQNRQRRRRQTRQLIVSD